MFSQFPLHCYTDCYFWSLSFSLTDFLYDLKLRILQS
jgi:hypothetical protein